MAQKGINDELEICSCGRKLEEVIITAGMYNPHTGQFDIQTKRLLGCPVCDNPEGENK